MSFYILGVIAVSSVYAFFIQQEENYYYRQPLKELFFFTAAVLLIVYKIHFDIDSKVFANLLLLAAIGLIFFLYKINLFARTSNKIVATQSNFWNVDPSKIKNNTQHRMLHKKNRIEYQENPLSRLRNENFTTLEISKKKLSQNFIALHLKEYDDFTVLKDEDIEKYLKSTKINIFKIVFKKIQLFIEEKEISVDYQDIFSKNKYCVEFFLMQLWEEHSEPFSYGVGTLQSFIYDDKLNIDERSEAFLYAMDATRTTTVNRKGFSLYYYYYFFKNKELENK